MKLSLSDLVDYLMSIEEGYPDLDMEVVITDKDILVYDQGSNYIGRLSNLVILNNELKN